ncbi:DUF2806 domain-containing protein [Niabella sp. 22666]|uniref:DUF2806 domain-containing protein n=1 Tax=Niabella sp. 22666 TaxID=3453954 RepID=UPI003F83EE5C
MNLNDMLGLGKILPGEKLLDVVSKMTGRLTKHYFDKKDIDTKAYEIKKLAEARAVEMKTISDAVKENAIGTGGIEYKEEKLQISSPRESVKNNINDLPSIDLEHRTKERLLFQEAKKQINIESITTAAAEQLKNEQPIEDTPVDDDWMGRFFNIAEDISNEEMQMLWGKILAGEIKRPKSYSLRTLELIKNLSKEEATIIMKVANFVLRVGNDYFLHKGDGNLLEKFGITYHDIALLTEVGIIQPGDFVSYTLNKTVIPVKTPIIYGSLVMIIERQANASEISIPLHLFTKTGVQVLKLLEISPSFEYLKATALSLQKEDTTLKYGNLISDDGNIIEHTMPLKAFE